MRRAMVIIWPVLLGTGLVVGLLGPAGGADKAADLGKSFADITKESGVAQIIADKYAKDPKWWHSGLHLVDLDGDGKLDLFLSAHGGGKAVAALNDGKGHFTPAPGEYPGSEIHLAYDADEDGKVDLTMTFQDGGGKWWLNRSKPGSLHFEGTKIERGTNTARRQAMIDIDRDGKVDWLRGTPRGIVFDRGDGKGGFPAGKLDIPLGNNGPHEVLCLPIDLDGDGSIDLLTEWGHYRAANGHSRILRNDGKMKFADVTKECGLNDGEGMSIKGAGDVNQDGFPDLFVLENKKPEVYLNDGKGKFTKLAGAITGMKDATRPSYSSWGLAVVTDFDNDGIPDILWNGKHFLWVLRGIGDGRFEYMNKSWGIKDLSASSVDDGHCFGDIDGDGALDIVGYTAVGNRRWVAVYRNDLPKNNWVNVRPIGRTGNRGAAGAKVRLYAPGTRDLLWYEQVTIYDSQAATCYYSYGCTERHYGLGQRATVDVSVEFYPSGVRVDRAGVKAGTTLEVKEDD
ncbi:MAG TPA: VCBS repeat-containing protein [Gemmataceae bacterium]